MTVSRRDKAKFVDRTIIEHNDLIASVAKMDKIPMKMFELAVSCIDTYNPPEDNTVHLSKKEIFSFFGVDDSNKNYRFKKAIERMQQQAYFEIREVKGKKGYKYRRIVPIPYISWNDYDDDVIVRFDQAIIPYLIDLKQNFTQYALTDIMGLTNKYSIVLYRWLSMNYSQYEYYKEAGTRRDDQLNQFKNPTISIDELRRMTDTLKRYDRMSVFSKWILAKPCDEITEHTHLNVEFEKIKSKRRVVAVRFKVTGKPVARLNNKNEQDIKQKEKDRRRADSEDYLNAMQSTYTRMLSTAHLLTPDDLMNQKTMCYLYRHVYPQYREVIKLGGGGTVGKHTLEEHLIYVSRRRVPNRDKRKDNIGKYLDTAVQGYITRLRNKYVGDRLTDDDIPF
ncbi:RepB family plasmid replication initiator protein [Limosilactobacillus rudii]|uniref:RepB family plasmid replication initiator protein n=1 Tax=Limosilactobacillus rudii TaxID=2759755 RepID=UPI0015FA5BFA|nr:RepB family plasmid replication initiator protein [Limosilactobacillus rudii]MBB1078306.1 RepB family plasmid replication initiator protein [Limosilactobacillus rudii]